MYRVWIALCVAATGCSWVQLTEAGSAIRVGTAEEVVSCEKLGTTRTKTSDRALIFSRRHAKVDEELEFLARNEAAELDGDTVVPLGPTSDDGRRSFGIYRCH